MHGGGRFGASRLLVRRREGNDVAVVTFDPVDIDRFAILPGRVKERPNDACGQIAVLEFDMCALDGKWASVFLDEFLANRARPKQETYSAVALVSASMGPTQWVAYHIGGRPGQ